MKLIYLSGGRVTKVSDEDYESLSRFTWFLSTHGYAFRKIYSGGKEFHLALHHCVLDPPDGMEIDHRDCDRLNNTRENLRICTRSQNQLNVAPKKGRKFKGTIKNAKGGGYSAKIMVDGVVHPLGSFSTEEAAARAYDKKAHELAPEFSRLNFETGLWNEDQLDEFRLRVRPPKSGVKGVIPMDGCWVARISWRGKKIHVGTFKTIEEASTAREEHMKTLTQ